MDFTIPEEITAIGDALMKFVDREVVALEDANRALLSSERTIFNADGRYSDEVLSLRRKVRMRSAELGFYNLFGPTSIGNFRGRFVRLRALACSAMWWPFRPAGTGLPL